MVRAAALLLLLLAGPADAGCRLALALGFDVSKSVSAVDYEIQRGGIIAALQDRDVRNAFLKPAEPVALAIFEWSGRDHQQIVLPWTEMGDAAALDQVIGLMASHLRDPKMRATALGHALIFADEVLQDAPDCARQTLDISGDGRNNDGYSPANVFADRAFAGVTINALAIGGHESDIAAYYHDQVIRGPGAFVMQARRHEEFPEVIRRKLLRELTDALMGDTGFRAPKG